VQRTSRSVLSKVTGGLLLAVLAGCTTVEFNEGSGSGIARVGAFSSIETAQKRARVACGLDKDDPFQPIETGQFLPVITHTVHFFKCAEPAKDTK